eukprot:695599-Rhodomonas_salina.1
MRSADRILPLRGCRISVEGVAAFVPKYKLQDDPANDGVTPHKDANGYSLGTVEEETVLMAHMANVMRAAYFSTVPRQLYIGTHDNEIMWIFPTIDKENYIRADGPLLCDSSRDSEWGSIYRNVRSSTYNPVCRPWYQRASLSPHLDIVYNPIDFSASYDKPV